MDFYVSGESWLPVAVVVVVSCHLSSHFSSFFLSFLSSFLLFIFTHIISYTSVSSLFPAIFKSSSNHFSSTLFLVPLFYTLSTLFLFPLCNVLTSMLSFPSLLFSSISSLLRHFLLVFLHLPSSPTSLLPFLSPSIPSLPSSLPSHRHQHLSYTSPLFVFLQPSFTTSSHLLSSYLSFFTLASIFT